MQWLKQLWDWARGLLGTPAAQPTELKPDLSLIRNYDRGLQTKEEPYHTSYVAHFHKNNKHLYYVAATHEFGPDNDTFKTIRAVMAKHKPQLVVIEGLDTQSGLSPDFYKNYVKQKAEENFATAEEPLYAAHLAIQNGLPFMGGEPTDQEIFGQMDRKGYSAKDMVAFYLLRWIPRGVGHEGVNKMNFDHKAQEYIDHLKCYHQTPPDQRLTVEEFKAWYELHNDQPSRSYLQIDTQNLAPVRSQHASYFENMSADISKIREEHLDKQIGDAFADHDRVLVVYGGGHLVQSRRVFEKMFEGNAEHAKLC